MPRARLVPCAVTLVVSALAVAGCTSVVSGNGAHSQPPASAGSTASTAPPTAAALGGTLQRVGLHDADLGTGYRLQLIPGGAQVHGQVTLDNCGFDFTTEAHRVARRQYEILTQSGRDTGLSNELVAYDSSGQASTALAQWHTAAAHCPHEPVRTHLTALPRAAYRITRNDLDLPTLPVPDNALTVETATVPGRGTFYGLSVLQTKDRFLDNLYLTSARPLSSAAINTALRLATITGRRLTQLH